MDGDTAAGARPTILVCTHGVHDTCCAVRGRPTAKVLSERWPDLVWECSHIGGDRFAANILMVPDGVYYGYASPEEATAAIDAHLGGLITAQNLRGYTDLPPVDQAAVAGAIEVCGPAGRDDFTIVSRSHEGSQWTVRVHGQRENQGTLEVTVDAIKTPPRRLTCKGIANAAAFEYWITSVTHVT